MKLKSIFQECFPLAGLIVIVLLFLFNVTYHSEQQYEVNKLKLFESLEIHTLYLWVLIGSFIFPFILSFDRRVQFYTKWIILVKATIIPALIFIIWDIIFTKNGVWGFNGTYLVGKSIFGLPLEELLWFLVIPYCCVFIYECIQYYITPQFNKKVLKSIIVSILLLLVCLIFLYKGQIYTVLTFTTGAFFCIIMLINMRIQFVSAFLSTWLISLIPFLIVNGVLTGAFTKEPIVAYSSEAIIGIRMISIPIEDAIYLWSYLFIIIWMYELFKKKEVMGT
jgi:lycopene cyclase domain-containing protein